MCTVAEPNVLDGRLIAYHKVPLSAARAGVQRLGSESAYPHEPYAQCHGVIGSRQL